MMTRYRNRRYPIAAGAAALANWVSRNPNTSRRFANTARGYITRGANQLGRTMSSIRSNMRAGNRSSNGPLRRRQPAARAASGGSGGTRTVKRKARFAYRSRYSGGSSYGGGRRKRKGGGMMKLLRNHIYTPQVFKSTYAWSSEGEGHGLRSWGVDTINHFADVQICGNRRPVSTFMVEAIPGVATTQTPYGRVRSLRFTKICKNYTIQNRCNWDMQLKIYECELRHDDVIMSSGTEASHIANIKTLFANNDVAGANQGPLQPTYAGVLDGLAFVYQNPTYTPYMSSAFCLKWKILKTHNFKLGPNDYVKKAFYGKRTSVDMYRLYNSDIPNGRGGCTKLLLFSWVGGPIDTGELADGKQSKSTNDLAIQVDYDMRFYFVPVPTHLYTIGSSNNTAAANKGSITNSTYDTLTADIMAVPATATIQTVAGAPAPIDGTDLVLEVEA